MLTVVSGPFHPHLEHALADDLIAAKAGDPFAPLLVVVPSKSLRQRVIALLAGERRQVLLNVSVVTFHQLSRRLVEEAAGRSIPTLIDDHAFEELMRLMLDRQAPGPLSGVTATRGGCAALWQTLRDLKDAKVSPDGLLDAVAEGVFPSEDRPRLEALAALYRDVWGSAESAGWVDYTQLDAAAVEAAMTSTFLKTQRNIAYYGFYDLTQAQYDVLRAVSARGDGVVYFPAVSGHADWAFADRFLQRYLLGLTVGPVKVLGGPTVERPVTEVTCSGANDEVIACAKAIVQLVDEEGFAFEDIGVVARSLDPYSEIVAREFARHGVPFVTGSQRGLSTFPLVQAAVRLLRIAEGDPTREDVIELLCSPWCRIESLVPGVEANPAWWDELARSVGVIRGYEAWERLVGLAEPAQAVEAGARTRGAHAVWLLRLVHELRAWCAALPDRASGAGHATAWRERLGLLFGVVSDPEAADAEEDEASDDAAVSRALIAAFDDPARLDAFRPTITRQQYLEAVRRRIDATTLPIVDWHARGVLVADATAARGVGFRALFVLGLNDGVFPRVIREDAFLRDRERRVIETTLGCKIPEKLAGYDEERLLFAALVQAGRERLILSRQRADDTGRPLAPSWYLAAWREAVDGVARVEIPRRAREKPRVAPFDRLDRYTPHEAAVLAALLGVDANCVADERTARFLARAGRVRRSIDAWASALSPFDGDVGPLPEWLAEARTRAYSASGLQTYSECPWRFFITRVLGVTASADADQCAGPTVREWGSLAHELLARAARPDARPVDSLWREVCDRYGARHGTGYPLMWELNGERIGCVLGEVVADDRHEQATSGYSPLESEVVLRGVLGGEGGSPIQGRLDRVDAGADGSLRVIDWKLRWTRSSPRGGDLIAAALRGQALQPPIYAALAEQYGATRGGGTPGSDPAVAVYTIRPLAWSGAVDRSWYEPDAETVGRIRATVSALVSGIEAGLFPMIPDTYCSRCDVAAACRRRHAVSRVRAERDPRAARLAGIRRTPVRGPKRMP